MKVELRSTDTPAIHAMGWYFFIPDAVDSRHQAKSNQCLLGCPADPMAVNADASLAAEALFADFTSVGTFQAKLICPEKIVMLLFFDQALQLPLDQQTVWDVERLLMNYGLACGGADYE